MEEEFQTGILPRFECVARLCDPTSATVTVLEMLAMISFPRSHSAGAALALQQLSRFLRAWRGLRRQDRLQPKKRTL